MIERNERNPRKITPERLKHLQESLERFGEISCIVFNRRTGLLVSGHQRRKALEADASNVTITEKFDRPDNQGTVALGYIEHGGERYRYREVDWSEATETAAMVAANAHGGTWDKEMLRELLSDISEGITELTITGMTKAEIDQLMRIEKPLALEGGEEKGIPAPEESEEVPTGQHVRMLQLFLNEKNHPGFIARIKRVCAEQSLANTTEAVIYAINREFERIGATNEG